MGGGSRQGDLPGLAHVGVAQKLWFCDCGGLTDHLGMRLSCRRKAGSAPNGEPAGLGLQHPPLRLGQVDDRGHSVPRSACRASGYLSGRGSRQCEYRGALGGVRATRNDPLGSVRRTPKRETAPGALPGTQGSEAATLCFCCESKHRNPRLAPRAAASRRAGDDHVAPRNDARPCR
jgi:hypothetical protein